MHEHQTGARRPRHCPSQGPECPTEKNNRMRTRLLGSRHSPILCNLAKFNRLETPPEVVGHGPALAWRECYWPNFCGEKLGNSQN